MTEGAAMFGVSSFLYQAAGTDRSILISSKPVHHQSPQNPHAGLICFQVPAYSLAHVVSDYHAGHHM
jgi:hypothetical protein